MTANERRLSILETLCERRKETRANLAFEFGVCLRTIDYDVQFLSLKYPVYTEQGNGGGIYVSNGFRLMSLCMNEEEVSVIKELIQTQKGRKKAVLQRILKKYGKQEVRW